jgi:transcriptional regulator with XRE-family HTH domain
MDSSPGDQLREARKRKSLTQREVAALAGVTKQAISDYERNVYRPSEEVLAKLAAVYETTPAALRYGPLVDHGSGIPAPGVDPLARATIERPMPRVLRTHGVRLWLRKFLFDLQKAGASQDQITEAEDIITAPEQFTWYRGGRPTELNEQEAIIEMEATAETVWRRLERRGLRRPE